MRWKKTKVLSSLIEEVKVEYLKVIKKLQVDGIIKPIPNPNHPIPEKSQEKLLKTV